MNDSAKLQPWHLHSSDIVFETPWFRIEKQELETPGGAKPTFYVHDTQDSVMCVCVTDDGKVLIEKQYRPAVRKVSYDYPAGKLEDDDASIEGAMLRELKEETGYQTTLFKKLAVIDKDPGFSTTRMHIFLAQGMIPGESAQEDTESIVSNLVPAEEVLEMIRAGKLSCAFCVSATYYAFMELGWLRFAPQPPN